MGGLFESPADCREHEKTCEYRPTMRTCATCSNLDFDDRCWKRKVRPKCKAYGDRKYRKYCDEWKPNSWARKVLES